MINKRQRGAEYEELAAKYLISKGYRILERNYSDRAGEIDIIASKDGMLIFCEVKYRGGTGYGSALEAVGLRKQRRICRTAMHYYAYHGCTQGIQCRFDVIAIDGEEIEHVENAFEYVV